LLPSPPDGDGRSGQDRIGLYVIVRLIGQGGMGLTLEAMQPDLESPAPSSSCTPTSPSARVFGRCSLSLVVFIIHELLEALKYAHDRMLNQLHDIGVIHHDVTPGNIMVSSSGEVVLTDFGIAPHADESGWEPKPIGRCSTWRLP
jgi:serine/threonine protein kinase